MKAVTAFLCLSLIAACVVATNNIIGKHFQHIFIIQFENHSNNEATSNVNFAKFTKMGTHLNNYFAVAHPSQPNYIAQASGSTLNCHDDNYVTIPATEKCLADLMLAKNMTWKLYQEDYPGNCFDGMNSGKYYRRHNPFIAFESVRHNKDQCAKIVNADELQADLAAGKLPQFSYFTPNIDNDAHNTDVKFAGEWLAKFLTPLLSNKAFISDTLVVLTWDEDDYTENNQISTILLGPNIKPGFVNNDRYNHYDLLATIEDNFGLGNLGRNDSTAQPFNTNVYLR
eukprot:TRINITY_DN44_c0_g1_i1.p1 TRINITY_DN44_c0_g1~~TRINITY_DN44_c0_g1_i1.p1  ORF type:complete len:298 (-),score=63.91 TRINITY_DN44_c0_g1_i1:741-1592(-)